MTTEQTAQQLELAAQLIRTGHPFEFGSGTTWNRAFDSTPFDCLKGGYQVRPVLATPPDNRPLHNPDNFTAEQVGVGYRLTVKGETANLHTEQQEYWVKGKWEKSGEVYTDTFDRHQNARCTYRLPLSVPWPELPDPFAELKKAHAAGKVIECITGTDRRWMPMQGEPRWFLPVEDYRIKPEPAFQLPPCAPGMRWHREDGWKADDLPQGYRPLYRGEEVREGDEVCHLFGSWGESGNAGADPANGLKYRTTRPLTFNHAGKTWTWHKPGDPMPCDGGRKAYIMYQDQQTALMATAATAGWARNENRPSDIIGWRYADETKTVPFDISDVPPCSVLSLHPPRWFDIYGVCKEGIYVLDDEPLVETLWKWNYLAEKAQINRSIPLTGKWNPSSWEPCHKTISQNG